MEVLHFLWMPFLMCVILIGIHCYLGLHVLERGIIFVDLSLAQVACFGGAVGLLMDFEHHSWQSYLFSLGFCFVAAGYFSWIKKFEKTASQEVVIALVYAFSSASVILVVNSLSHGAEHLKEILIGKILWVLPEDLLKTSVIYSVVGLLHYWFRKPIYQGTRAEGSSSQSGFWDFVFYALFGVVISSSVGTAGILLVFCFLVVPALMARSLFATPKQQLFGGWVVGLFLAVLGMAGSFFLDLPAGAVLVCVFAGAALLAIPLLAKRRGLIGIAKS